MSSSNNQRNLTKKDNLFIVNRIVILLSRLSKLFVIVGGSFVLFCIIVFLVIIYLREVQFLRNTVNEKNFSSEIYIPIDAGLSVEQDTCDTTTQSNDYGERDENSKLIIFETLTRCEHRPSSGNFGRLVYRYYVMDVTGNYRRHIYTTDGIDNNAYANFVDGQYLQVCADFDCENIITTLSLEGEIIKNYQSQSSAVNLIPYNYLLSPDGRYLAERNFTDEYVDEAVRITNQQTGEQDVYKFDAGLNGVYIDSWSPDSKVLYVAGGVYEFEASARLWKVYPDQKEVVEMSNLDEFMFPITVFPDDGFALVRTGNSWVEEKNIDIDLYKYNLTTGEKVFMTKENAAYVFYNFVRWGDWLLYSVEFEGGKGAIMKLNLNTAEKKDYVKNARLIEKIETTRGPAILYIQNHIYKIKYLETGDIVYIGRSESDEVPQNEVEFINEIIGITAGG